LNCTTFSASYVVSGLIIGWAQNPNDRRENIYESSDPRLSWFASLIEGSFGVKKVIVITCRTQPNVRHNSEVPEPT
jgi:hypothetical protein